MSVVRVGAKKRMSEAVLHNGVAYLSGIVGREGTDTASQMRAALAEVDRVLARVGSDRTRILSVMVWLADMADIDAMNAVWDEWVDGAHLPVRATGGVALARDKYLVEVMVTAAVDNGAAAAAG